MKTLAYEREKMERAGRILNSITISGATNCRLMAELADILDSGIPSEMADEEEKEEDKKCQ